jgi:hypothetical protein
MPQFHETVMGNRFYNMQLPALIDALKKSRVSAADTKKAAIVHLAAGVFAGDGGMSADGAANRAVETYEAIERKLS